jgi:hypothetical protein
VHGAPELETDHRVYLTQQEASITWYNIVIR